MGDATQVSGQPVLRAVFFDGGQVYASFTPTSASTAGYSGNVYSGEVLQTSFPLTDPATSWLQVPGVSFGTGAFMSLSLEVLPANLSLSATANFPRTPAPYSTLLPVLTEAVRFDDGSVRALWTALSDAGESAPLVSYVLMLHDAISDSVCSAPIAPLSAAQGSLGYPLPLVIGNALEFRLIALNASNAGTSTPAWSVIGAAPTGVRVAVGADAIEVWWTPSLDPAAARHVPRLYSLEDGWYVSTSGSSDRSGHGSIAFNPSSTKTWFVVVLAAGDEGSNVVAAASTPIAVPRSQVALVGVDALPGALAMRANPGDDSAIGANVLWRVLGAQGELGRVASLAGPAAIQVDPSLVTTLAWRVIDGSHLALEQQVALNLGAVTGVAIATSAVNGSSTLSWDAAAGASGYRIDLGLGGAPILVDAQTTSLALPASAQTARRLAPQVAAQFLVGTAQVTAQPSVALCALPPPPTGVEASYDGAHLQVQWAGAADADSYQITAYDRASAAIGVTQTVPASATSVELPLAAGSRGQDWQLVVQSLLASVAGVPSLALTLIEPGWYIGAPASGAAVASAQCAPLPDAAAVASFAAGKGVDLAWLLPALGPGPLTDLPGTASFKLVANDNPDFPYALEIASTSTLWSFDGSGIRASLRSDLKNFLLELEANGAAPWGLDLVQRVLARGAPLTFQETLYVEYGLTGPAIEIDQDYGSFDVRPGMILRLSTAAFVDLDPDSSGDYLNGFVATGSIDYEIGTETLGSSWRPLADAFIGQLIALGATEVKAPPASPGGNSQGGIADAGDLLYPTLSQPFLRVIVPSELLSPNGSGSAQANAQFTIAGASSYQSLCAIGSPPTATPFAFFGGRTLIKACVRISVNGTPQTVAIGTTLADVLAAHGAAPPLAQAAISGVDLRRRTGPRVASAETALDPTATQSVFVNWGGLAIWGAANALSIPLLAGDEIWF